MPSRATLFFLLSQCLPLISSSASFDRRLLHQPFFPVESSPPPSEPPAPSPPVPKYPFSGSSPDESPFFPTYPSPPPPPSPPSSSTLASFPANISSLTFPHPNSSHKHVSPGLVAVTVALSACAVAIAAVSLFLYFRGRRRRAVAENKSDAVSRSDRTRPPATSETLPVPPKRPRNSSNNSAEFLYLGTLANSRGVDSAGNNGGAARRGGGGVGGFEPRKLDSPDLQPLPPLARQSMRPNLEGISSAQEDEEEEFYSPRGSASGRGSFIGVDSGSRRVFASVQAEQLIQNDSSNATSSSSGSSSSDTCSPARSLSISPALSASPKSSKPKSPDFSVEMQAPSPTIAPPSPQLPPMSFSYSPPPPVAYSSPEGGLDVRVKEEAEESPLLINGTNSSRMSSPVESPRLSPLRAIGRRISPVKDWSLFDRNQLSPLSDRSISSRKSSSIKLPRFLGGRNRIYSPESTRMSDSPAASPLSTTSPISSSVSAASRCYPPSPSLLSDSGRSLRSNPASLNFSSRRLQSTPPSPGDSCRRSQHSSPELHRLSNVSDKNNHQASFVPPQAPPAPPPPPPLPPAMRRSESPVKPMPVSTSVVSTPEPARSVEKVDSARVSPSELGGPIGEAVDSNDSTPKLKLKPLHWDKVRASSDCEMVWDQLRCSSFKLNEEMIETLFVVNTPNSKPKQSNLKPVQPSPKQENRVLDPKKAQNIAISLRALNVTVEEVCEALLEGNAETLGTELLECLLKMAPSKEEEWKLKEYRDDSPCKLGHAERFLKTVIGIPFAFKRIEAMLYVANFESEVEYLKKSFETLEAACDELRSSRMFLKLLEAVLKTGNRMNVGTNRGDAHAFKLDTLLKLVDVKGADGKTTLLHFVVQEITRSEGARLCSTNDDAKCRKLGLQVVSGLSSDLGNVKKAAGMDSEALSSEVAKLSRGLANIAEVVRLNVMMTGSSSHVSCRKFSESMNGFIRAAEEKIIRVQAQESVALSLVKEITEYFHGNSAKEEAHPFRIFMVVRDFIRIVDRVCKEVGMINDRTVVMPAHKFPVPVNPTLPQGFAGFQRTRQSSSDEESF
ncbi:hypothetical protein V2J09_016814 [Rumex salicifolius]